ncbi:MAG: M14 family zinc carboxypeptidase [Pyrinomonadaceae bacterium]
MDLNAQTPEELAEIWDQDHVTNKFPSDVRHKDLQVYLDGLRKLGVRVDEVGRSNANREIYQIEFGRGKTKVFLWSQMHGDEPTATSALIDIFTYLQKNRDKDWVTKIESELTIRAVPMLNPDGAELFQRRNLQSIDINRDAAVLQTPEGKLLKKLRDEWSPEIGFNLHNQGSLTTVGRSGQQAAISLLVVFGDAAKTKTEGLERNRRIAGAMTDTLRKFIPNNIGRYDDGYNGRAFGDNFSAWGTPVILIETGALHGKDEMFLVKMNFAALVTAMKVLSDGSADTYDPASYDALRSNGSGSLYSALFRGANIVRRNGLQKVFIADIAINLERRRASFAAPAYIREVGDLGSASGLDEYDASGFYVVPRFGLLAVSELGELLFYKKDRSIDWRSKELEKSFPPDAVFSGGKWSRGEAVVPRRSKL